MGLFTGIDTVVELAEHYAEEMGEGFASESALSEAFDDGVAESVIAQYGEDDTVAMSEAFNNWSDGLCKDGELHPSQYESYCYVGEYSDD